MKPSLPAQPTRPCTASSPADLDLDLDLGLLWRELAGMRLDQVLQLSRLDLDLPKTRWRTKETTATTTPGASS